MELGLPDLVRSGFELALYVWFVCFAATYLLRTFFRWIFG